MALLPTSANAAGVPRRGSFAALAGWPRRFGLGALLFCWLLGGSALPGVHASEAIFSEQEVKAAWLLNFARFVEWPSNTFARPNLPIQVAVLTRDPFGKELERAFQGKIVQGRPLSLKRVANEQDLQSCHLFFFSYSERRRTRDWLDRCKNLPVLTVGESDEFLDQGGIVNFVLKENAVRFEVNVKAAQRSGLKLDANLLKIALRVRGRYD